MNRTIIVMALGAGILTGSALADTHYVAQDGSHATPFTNWVTAATNIPAAIGVAVANDTVLVSNGIYAVTSYVSIDKGLTLCGVKGSADTIIDAGGVAPYCLYIAPPSPYADPVYVSGFTLRNGGAGVLIRRPNPVYLSDCIISSNIGINYAGIYQHTDHTNSLVVSNCHIVYNTTTGAAAYGTGVSLYGKNARFYDCVIAHNTSSNIGGGVFVDDDVTNLLFEACNISSNMAVQTGGGIRFDNPAVINRCTIDGNYAGAGGGGVYVYNGVAWSYISNCVIRNNSAQRPGASGAAGGGVAFQKGNCTMTGCLISGNHSLTADGYGGGAGFGDATYTSVLHNVTIVSNTSAYRGGGIATESAVKSTIINSLIYDNTASTANSNVYIVGASVSFTNSCIAPTNGLLGTGNIEADPKFVAPEQGDWRLANGSPCINAGLNEGWMTGAVDLDGRARLDRWTGIIDMGAYEYLFSGTMFVVY